MHRIFLLVVALLALSRVQLGGATCHGHNCDEEHERAVEAGLLGDSRDDAPVDSGAVRPKECKAGKVYPKDKLVPLETEAPMVDVVWTGRESDQDKYVFALLRGSDGMVGGHLYWSDYYGKPDTWDDRTNEMTDAVDEKDRKDLLVGVIDIKFHKDHPGHMLFQGPGHTHWTSEDYGATFQAHRTPGGTLGYGSEIKIHPTQPNWVLALVRRNECLQEATAISKWCAKDLFLSEDFARTWRNLTEGSGGRIASVWDFEWGSSLHRKKDDPFPDTTIFATVYQSAAKMKGPYPGWDQDMHFVVTKDYFKSAPAKTVPCGNQFEIIHNQVYLAAPADCPVHPDGSKRKGAASGGARAHSRTVELMVSDDGGSNFQEACIPIKWLDLGYNLVKTHDGNGAFIIVDADELDDFSARAPISNIYSAGPNATIYTLGMRRNYRRGYVTDFARIEGLPGMYLANQVDGKIFKDPSLLPTRTSYDKFVQTKMSFNGAASWQELQTPTRSNFPECITCKPSDTCKLHLHGPSSWHYGEDARPSFYSHKSAPGVVMAVGNTGEYLESSADATCTWLSSDGGQSWMDILPTAAIYEVGDHGGIIMMALHQTTAPTDEIYFTLDSGACWYTVQLSEAINVQNIRVEPKGESDTFIVHGQACSTSRAHPTCTHDPTSKKLPGGRSYTIDISDIMGSDLPECKASDYEEWSPPQRTMCLLGRNYTMQRRKTDANCFNSYGFDSKPTSEPCPCKLADTECEFGFEYNPSAHECVAIHDVDINKCELVKQKKYYESSTHRRLIHEDTCSGIETIIPDNNGAGIPKGGLPKEKGSGWAHFFLFLLVVGAVVLAFGVWWSKFAEDSTKAAIEAAVSPAFELCVGLVGGAIYWCREKWRGRGTAHSEAQEAFFQPLSGGEGPLDDFADAEDRRSAPVFGYR